MKLRSSSAVGVLALAALAIGCGKTTDAATVDPAPSASAAVATSAPSASASHAAKPAPSATVAQTASHAPAPPPPKKITGAEAESLLQAAAAEFKSSQRSCAKVTAGWAKAMDGVEKVTPAMKDATYGAARCYEATHDYNLVKVAGAMLARMDAETERYAFVPRALIGMNQDQDGAAALVDINKRHPNQPEVLFTAAQLLNKKHLWSSLVEAADATVKAVAASPEPETKSFAWRAQVLRHVGNLNLGKLELAEKDIGVAEKAGAPAHVVDELRKEIAPMKATKIGVDVTTPPRMFLGTYHLFGRSPELGNLFTVSFVNFSGKDQVLKVELEVPGFTDKVTKSMTLLKGRSDSLALTPPLKNDFKPASMTAERPASVALKVSTDDGKVIFEDTRQMMVFPRDQFPAAEQSRSTIAAWVTPQVASIEDFMTAAKKRAGGHLPGNLAATMPQVKALYDELHERGMSYVLQSDFGYGVPQHVRLPADAIKTGNALCLDGAVVFATLMEKLGLKPIIMFVPGHAFVGWHAEPEDKAPPETIYWLETTMVGTQPFDVAVKTAQAEFVKHSAAHATTAIDILEVRKKGFSPMPWD